MGSGWDRLRPSPNSGGLGGNNENQVSLQGLGESQGLRECGFRGLASEWGNERKPKRHEAWQRGEKNSMRLQWNWTVKTGWCADVDSSLQLTRKNRKDCGEGCSRLAHLRSQKVKGIGGESGIADRTDPDRTLEYTAKDKRTREGGDVNQQKGTGRIRKGSDRWEAEVASQEVRGRVRRPPALRALLYVPTKQSDSVVSAPSAFKIFKRIGHPLMLQATHQADVTEHLHGQMPTVQPYSSTNVISAQNNCLLWGHHQSLNVSVHPPSHTHSPHLVFFHKPSSSLVTTHVCPLPGLISLTQLRAVLHRPCSIQWLPFSFLQKPRSRVKSAFSQPLKSRNSVSCIFLLSVPRTEEEILDKGLWKGELYHGPGTHIIHSVMLMSCPEHQQINSASKKASPIYPTFATPITLTQVSLPIPAFYKGMSEVKSVLCSLKATQGQGLSFIHLWILSIYYKAQYLADKWIIWWINQPYAQISMKTEPSRKQKSFETTKNPISHKLDNQTLK